MRIRIHRGTKEIGGTCIEMEAQGRRIALDVGLPLDAPDDIEAHKDLLPQVPGFRDLDECLLGVLISHPHMDHYGLAKYVRPEVPVYIGEGAHNVMKAASGYVPNGSAFTDPHFIAHRKPVEIGPFRVTPYLVDHSAFDAYSLLVEADGKRVFYSGDFRAHGRKRTLFDGMVARPPKDIDVLLMEGTTIGRTGTNEGFATEDDLEQEFVQAFRETKGIHFVWTSSQNIDRLVTIFRATKRTDQLLLIDLYTAVVLEATGRERIPQASWDEVRVYIPHRQGVFIKEKGLFDDLGRHRANRIFPEALPDLATRAVMLFRPMAMTDHGVQAVVDGAGFTYSMWEGYLKEKGSLRVLKWLEQHGIPRRTIHTSGHAFCRRPQAFGHRASAPHAGPDSLFRDGPIWGVSRERRPEKSRSLVGGLGVMAIIERCWKRGSLKGHKKINPVYEQITKDISEGCVFPAVRENEIHLYYEGGRAFRVKPKSVKTHRKYNGECRDGEVSLYELTPGLYADIKERCRGRHVKRLQNGDCEEGWIVSRLFRRFSYWSRYAESEQPKLVDIEVRFRGKEKTEKIDLLFLEDDGRLRFVEVKRQDDPRTRWRYDRSTQSKWRNPEVLDQIRGYEDVLKDGGKSIVDAYGQVRGILAEALELERFSEPIAVCPRVPLLVCRRDAKHGRNTWLQGELGTCENDEIGDHLVVDGGSIETGSYRTRPPSWCPDGQWERLNLREVFGKIDNLGATSLRGR